jgi:Ca-activated chloride channel family protein
MNEIIQNFQFIRPQWLWILPAIVIAYSVKLKFGKDQNVWQQIIPAHLYQQMIVRKGLVVSNKFMHFAAASLLLAGISIAGPSWEKLPQAVYQTQAGKVILMDMSMSMRATDLSPDRLTRARFKAIDLVNEVKEGETGLVAYAGDAFVVSPLTDDVNTLISLIPVLVPEIMPIQGSIALNGLRQAALLLENAGYQQGAIYWVTDGIRYDEIKEVRNFVIRSSFDVSALLIGTETGAPIAMQDGQLLKNYSGKIVVPSINSRYMNQAMAGTKGMYHLFTNDNSDIQAIKRKIEFNQQQQSKELENTSGDTFKDMGPYLILLLLPVAAYSFRRGALSIVFVGSLILGLSTNSPSVYALQTPTAQNGSQLTPPEVTLANASIDAESLLDKAFKNADQRGKIAFDNKDYRKAETLFEDSEWLAASAYKDGNYEQAEELYRQLVQRPGSEQGDVLDNLYNKGNALAKQGKLEDALSAYNEVLRADPSYEPASVNKQLIEKLLEQQQQDKQDQNNDSSEQNSDEQEQSEQQGDSQDKQDQSKSGEEQNKDNSQQQSSEEKNSDQESSQQQNAEQKNDESLKQEAQEQAQKESQQAQAEQQDDAQNQDQESSAQEEQQSEQEQTSAISNQLNMENLTPEQKEELQRMQMILNKIPDNPAFLLQRKMQLEAYKRKSDPMPPEQQNW